MSTFQADADALQSLISNLQRFKSDLLNSRYTLTSPYNTFDSSYVSPNKASFEHDYFDLSNLVQSADAKCGELLSHLYTLQTYIQDAENVKF